MPPTLSARLFAVSRYALHVNGVEASRGPVRSNPRLGRYDIVDLAPLLRPGENVLAVMAWSYGGPTPWFLPAPVFTNDLGRGAFVMEAVGADVLVATDESWQGMVLDGWGASEPAGVAGRGDELIDVRALPAGWADAVDAPWPAAVARLAHTYGEPPRPQPPSYPYGPTQPRATTALAERAVALVPSGNGRYWSAAEIVAGPVVVDATVPDGATLRLGVAELTDAAGLPAPVATEVGIRIVGDGTRRVVTTVDSFGLRGAVAEAPEGTVVHGITVRERTHPVVGGGSFECDDETLNEIWRVGRRTVTLCSPDAYVDCPTREQRAWTGDSVVHQMVDLTTNSDWTLARWHPRLAATPRPDGMLPMAVAGDAEQADFTIIPDWALHWVHSVWNLYRYAGDPDEVASLLGVAEGVLRWFEPYCDDEGVPAGVVGWVIIDWASVYTEGASAALAGLWGRGLWEFAEMAEWLGDTGRARWARGLHERLAAGFERLWDPERRRYVDSYVDGRRQPTASQHGQAAAIVGRLAPGARLPRLVEVITDEAALVHATFSVPGGPAEPATGVGAPVGGDYLRTGPPAPWWDVDRQVVRAQPFFRYVVHDALAEAGRADLIARQCLDWRWALARCSTSWTETWFGGTVSHGWSSTPTRDLVTRVLGVRPAEPGFTIATVDPALGDLEWARGVVPTPFGEISVDVSRSEVRVTSPVPCVSRGRRHDAGTWRATLE